MLTTTLVFYRDKGQSDKALEAYKKALNIEPNNFELYSNMGVVLKDLGKPKEALAAYEKALSLNPNDPDSHVNLAYLLLSQGKISQGLDEFEWRWLKRNETLGERSFSKPIWNGKKTLKGKTILIWGEQGPQDMIIWATCLKNLIVLAKHCILECPAKLVPLFSRSFPEIEVRVENKNDANEPTDFDFHLPMGSLFKCFSSKISNQKITDAFIKTDSLRVDYWRKRLGALATGPFIGISWKSPVMTPARSQNYTKLSDWKPVLSNRNVSFINLQSTDFSNDLANFKSRFGTQIHNFDDLDHYDNLDDVAALCQALDMCISVSTAVAAIAAGVGTKTKVVTWRQSPWNNILYAPSGPNVEIVERNTWEPWSQIFEKIEFDIKNF